MKKFKMFALSIVAMLFMVNFVNAETSGAIIVEDYASLKAAIANTEITTITLTKDIVVTEDPGLTIASGRTIVIDLNGKNLSMISSKTTTSYLIKNQGSLTIKDSSDIKKDGTGSGKIIYSSTTPDTAASPGYASNTISNSGTIVLESGVIENSTSKAPAAHVIDNYSGSKITINGGKVNSVNNWAIRMFITSATSNNDLVMNNGYVNGGVKMQAATSQPKASFTMNDGTITGRTYGLYLYDNSTKGSDVNVKINGGNFTTSGESSYALYIYSTNANVEINGGTFTGPYALIYFTYHPHNEITHVINNGTFNGIVELDQKFTTNPEENYQSNFRINNGKFSSDVLVWGYDGTDWYISTNTQFIHGGVFANIKDEEGDYYWPHHIVSPYKVTSAMKSTPNGYPYTLGHKITLNANYEDGENTTIYTLTNGSMSELTEITREGYTFKGWNTKSDGTGKNITTKSTITEATTLYAQWELIPIETIVTLPTVDATKEVEEVVVGVQKSEVTEEVLLESLEEALKVEGNEELAEMISNSSAIVTVEVSPKTEENFNSTLIEEMQKVAGKATIATYFDISVVVKNASNGEHFGEIPELTKEIELMILLPEEFKNNDKNINRTYYIVRQHGDKIELLDAKLSSDGKSLVFKSDKFSTYALAYEDSKVEKDKVITNNNKNPKTSDNIIAYMLFAVLALVGIVVSSLTIKRKLFN